MKIRTKVDVTYNAPGKATGQESGKVEGALINTVWMHDFNTVGANFMYSKPDGTLILKDGFSLSNDDIETLYSAIKDSIPVDQNHRDTERTKYYLAFMFEMAKTFGVSEDDIELVP